MNKYLITILLACFLWTVHAQQLIPCRCMQDQFSGPYGYINRHDQIVTPLKYDGTLDPINGYGRVTKNNKWGMVDSTGKLVVPVEYSDVQAYILGDIAVVSNQKKGNSDPHVLALFSISEQKLITGFDYRTISSAGSGDRFIYTKVVNGYVVHGLLDYLGNELFQATAKGGWIYEKGPHSSGMYVLKTGGQENFLNSIGNIEFPDQGWSKYTNFYKGFAFVGRPGKWSRINTSGELIETFEFDDILRNSPNKGSFNVFVKNGLQGVVSHTGAVVISATYDKIHPCLDKPLFIVEKDSQWVLIDSANNHLSDKYDWIYHYKNGYFEILLDGKHGLMDQTGKVIVDLQYDEANQPSADGAYPVKLEDKWGLIDFNNNVVMPFEYYDIMIMSGGYIKYQKSRHHHVYYSSIDKSENGSIVIKALDKYNTKKCTK